MLDKRYWRATFDAEHKRFVVEQAGWLGDDQPALSYFFSYDPSPDSDLLEATLFKFAYNPTYNDLELEGYTFAEYPDEASFEAGIDAILTEARHRSEEHNLDFFLAVTDIVKERAVENGLDDNVVLDWEGLFEGLLEDAYSARDYEEDEDGMILRLHDHVERESECWRIYARPVTTPDGWALGWGVFALLFPGLEESATDEDVLAATDACLLDCHHETSQTEAEVKCQLLQNFMRGARLEDPTYARMDDSELLAMISVSEQHMIDTNAETVELMSHWKPLSGEALQAFHANTSPLIRDHAHWHKRADTLLELIAEQMDIPLHLADQYYARWLDMMQGFVEDND